MSEQGEQVPHCPTEDDFREYLVSLLEWDPPEPPDLSDARWFDTWTQAWRSEPPWEVWEDRDLPLPWPQAVKSDSQGRLVEYVEVRENVFTRAAPRAAMFTLSEAAAACGVSRSRIRRLLDAGAFPNAVQEAMPGKGTSAQVWHVPVPDLLAVGLVPNRDTNRPADSTPEQGNLSEQGSGQDLRDLEHELALERERRKAAEAIAVERERTIQGLEQALRLLGAGTPQASTDAATHEASTPGATHDPQDTPEAPPADLWGRLRRWLG